jgi:molecular chaperone GrpE
VSIGPEPNGPRVDPPAEPEPEPPTEPEPSAEPEPVDQPEAEQPDGAVDDDVIATAPVSVETLVDDLERLTKERDDYLDALRRTQADFDNYRKRVAKQHGDAVERAAEGLVDKLLPVLDACDGAVQHGETAVEPIFAALLGTLEKEGLERIDPGGETFDPTRHEAVMHEPDDGSGETVVADVMRRGYAWKGRLVRPAMVKVRG